MVRCFDITDYIEIVQDRILSVNRQCPTDEDGEPLACPCEELSKSMATLLSCLSAFGQGLNGQPEHALDLLLLAATMCFGCRQPCLYAQDPPNYFKEPADLLGPKLAQREVQLDRAVDVTHQLESVTDLCERFTKAHPESDPTLEHTLKELQDWQNEVTVLRTTAHRTLAAWEARNEHGAEHEDAAGNVATGVPIQLNEDTLASYLKLKEQGSDRRKRRRS